MLENDIRIFGGDFEDVVHVAKARREDDVVAFLSVVAKHAVGIGAFGYQLANRSLDTERFFHRLTTIVVRLGPAAILRRANQDKCGLDQSFRGRRCVWRLANNTFDEPVHTQHFPVCQ